MRQFRRVYAERVPDDTTQVRWANLIQPPTLHALLDHVVEMARQMKLTRGRMQVARGRHRRGSAKRPMKRIMQAARQRGSKAEEKVHTAYACLVEAAQATIRQARRVEAALRRGAEAAEKLAQRLGAFAPRLEQFIDQAVCVSWLARPSRPRRRW